MATIVERKTDWTLVDLARRFGEIPLGRVRDQPAPGTATEGDLLEILAREERLYELVDGILLEKVMGWYEAYLAMEIGAILRAFARPRKLGVVVGADGLYRLDLDLVRLPDVSFVSRDRLPGRRLPRAAICSVVPNLAVEVLSPSNTKKEMAEKRLDYFAAGVELVWYVDPIKKTVRVHTGPNDSRLLREKQTLDGGTVLPGFALSLRELFADPDDMPEAN